MAHSEKQKLQKARAYFKYVLSGLLKPVNTTYMSAEELNNWQQIIRAREHLLNIHDDTSRSLGLHVGKHICVLCGKKEDIDYKVTKDGETYNLCKKHFKEEINEGN